MYKFECFEYRDGADGFRFDVVSVPSQQEAKVWVYFHETFASILIEPTGESIDPPRFDMKSLLDFIDIYNLRNDKLGNCAFTHGKFVVTLGYKGA